MKEKIKELKLIMAKLLNIQCITNNDQNVLFRYFIPSLKYLQSLKDICAISINYNGKMTIQEVDKANKMIQNMGFELHWAINIYNFAPGRHRVIQIREDCDQIQKEKSPFILLVDDDLEFLPNYDKFLIAALTCMLEHDDVYAINMQRGKSNKYLERRFVTPGEPYICYPVGPTNYLALFGGMLLRRTSEEGIYPKEWLKLSGGMEDRIMAMHAWIDHKQVYRMFNDCYLHEQHWLHNEVICGINVYGWGKVKNEAPELSLDKRMEEVVSSAINDPYWITNKYWEDENNIYDYSQYDVQELAMKCLKIQNEGRDNNA